MAFDWSRFAKPGTWNAEVTPYILPILIRRAKERRAITYGELAEELEAMFGLEPQFRKTKYGYPVGNVGWALIDRAKRKKQRIPPLNAIVINAQTKLPGTAADTIVNTLLHKQNGKLNGAARRERMKQAMEVVWAYPASKWDQLAQAFDVPILKPIKSPKDDGKRIAPPKQPHHYGPESKQHKALKRWASENPQFFKQFGIFGVGSTEHWIASGDRLDAFFENSTNQLAVEVKASNAPTAEGTRGVFQCVKYQSVLQAVLKGRKKACKAHAVLVTTGAVDAETLKWLARLKVNHLIAPLTAESGK